MLARSCWIVGAVLVAVLFGGRPFGALAQSDRGRAELRTQSRATTKPPATLRVRVVSDEGILVVYNAPIARSDRPEAPSYLMLWRDFRSLELSIYSQLVRSPDEVAGAVTKLGAALDVDTESLTELAPWLRGSQQEREGDDSEPQIWIGATVESVGRVVGIHDERGLRLLAGGLLQATNDDIVSPCVLPRRATVPPRPEEDADEIAPGVLGPGNRATGRRGRWAIFTGPC